MLRTRLGCRTKYVGRGSSDYQPTDSEVQPRDIRGGPPNEHGFGKKPTDDEEYRKKYADRPIEDDAVVFRDDTIGFKRDRI